MDYTTELYYQKLQSEINRLNFRLCCLIDTFCDRVEACGGSSDGWLLIGNAGTSPGTNFIGTTDNQPLVFKTNGVIAGRISVNGFADRNTSIGSNTLSDATLSGTFNTAFGYSALRNDTSGSANVAVGTNSMLSNIDGSENVAVGSGSLSNNISGIQNTIIGVSSGGTISTGTGNTLVGYQADTATNSTANAIALGYGAVAGNAQFKISPNVTDIIFDTCTTFTAGDVNSLNNGTYIKVDDSTFDVTINNGFNTKVSGLNFGTTTVLPNDTYHIIYTQDTGATTLDISSAALPVGKTIVVSDLDRISSTSNITIDAGVGNTIVSIAGTAQTFILNQDGGSITLQKVTGTKWKII